MENSQLTATLQRAIAFLTRYRVLFAILTVGAVLRLWQLSSNPPGIWVDELLPWSGTFSMYQHQLFERPLQNYLNGISLGIFESIFVLGPSTLSGRLPGALIGVGLILATYKLSSTLFNKSVGTWSALLVAIGPLAVFSSRVFYLQEIQDAVFFLTIGSWLIIDGIRHDQVVNKKKLLIGYLLIGLVFNGYLSNRTTFTSLVLIVVLLLWAWRARSHSIPIEEKLWIFCIVPALIFLLLGQGIASLSSIFGLSAVSSGPIGFSSFYFGSDNILLHNPINGVPFFFRHYLSYFNPIFLFLHLSPNPSTGLQQFGVMSYVSLPFFFVGLIVMIVYFKNVPYSRFPVAFLLLWLLSAPVEASTNAFASSYPDNTQALVFLPVISIITGFGIYIFGERMRVYRLAFPKSFRHLRPFRLVTRKRLTRLTVIVIVVTYLLTALLFSYVYFDKNPSDVLNNPNSQWGIMYGFPQIAEYIAAHHLYSHPVYISPDGLYNNDTNAFNYYYGIGTYYDFMSYYSDGKITSLTKVYMPTFIPTNQSLLITGNPQLDTAFLRSNGFNGSTILTVFKPNGTESVSLVEMSNLLTYSQLQFIHEHSLFSGIPTNRISLTVPNQSLVMQMTGAIFTGSDIISKTVRYPSSTVYNSFTLSMQFNLSTADVPTNSAHELVDWGGLNLQLAPSAKFISGATNDSYLPFLTLSNASSYVSLYPGFALFKNVDYLITISFLDGYSFMFLNNSLVAQGSYQINNLSFPAGTSLTIDGGSNASVFKMVILPYSEFTKYVYPKLDLSNITGFTVVRYSGLLINSRFTISLSFSMPAKMLTPGISYELFSVGGVVFRLDPASSYVSGASNSNFIPVVSLSNSSTFLTLYGGGSLPSNSTFRLTLVYNEGNTELILNNEMIGRGSYPIFNVSIPQYGMMFFNLPIAAQNILYNVSFFNGLLNLNEITHLT